jgi:hypothetical protein
MVISRDFVAVLNSEFFRHVQPFFIDIQEMRHYELRKVSKR